MKLEVISKYPRERTHPNPILLVHGAWHGAWAWENVLSYLAEHGYEVHALSLRGHGKSEGRERIRWHSLKGYLADVAQVADGLGSPPILVAHSMGGYIVQKYLEQHTAPAAVLLTSVPTSGILAMLLRWAVRRPVAVLKMLVLLNPWYLVSTPVLAKEAFFSDDYPDEQFMKYWPLVQPESLVVALEMALLNLPHPAKVKTPMLVLGAENDRIFTTAEQHKTARAYHTEATLYPHTAHDMMLEPAWQAAADQVLSWLAARKL